MVRLSGRAVSGKGKLPVDLVGAVKVGKSFHCLANDGGNILLSHSLLEDIKEVRGGSEATLHGHPDVLALDITPKVLHRVWVAQRRNELNLLHDIAKFLRIQTETPFSGSWVREGGGEGGEGGRGERGRGGRGGKRRREGEREGYSHRFSHLPRIAFS